MKNVKDNAIFFNYTNYSCTRFYPLKIKITQFPDGFHLKILKKGKLECLIFEMLFLRDKRTMLNTQADSCETVYLINVCSFSRLNFTCTFCTQSRY